MANYQPPSEYTPVFDVTNFRETNDNVLTETDADRMYLSRQGVASSLATSTNFLGTVSCGGNLTLNAPTAANRQIESSFLKLRDNASTSTNKPLIWYPDPSLEITTNDVIGTIKTIDLKSYDGSATGVNTTMSAYYGEVKIDGALKICQIGAIANYSKIQMGANNLTVSNSNAIGNILLNTTGGSIVANSIIVPSNNQPAIITSRPSIGYSYYGAASPVSITATSPVNLLTSISIPIGTWMFEASVLVTKSTSTFRTAAPLSTTRLAYLNATSGLSFIGVSNDFEIMFANDLISGAVACGIMGPTRIVTITTAQQIPMTFQANWDTIAGTPSFLLRWSVIRIA